MSDKKVKAKLYRRNNDEIIVQIRRFPWPFKVLMIPPFTPLPILFWLLGYRGEYRDEAVLNSLVYEVDDELNLLALEAKELFSKRTQMEDIVKANLDFIKSSEKAMKNYSEEFWLDLSLLRQMEDRDAPKTSWKEVFKLGETKNKTVREKLGASLPEDRQSTRAAFLPEDLKGLKYTVEDLARVNYHADDVLFNVKNNKGGEQGNQDPFSRKKRKDLNESDLSHQRRLEAMKNGSFDPSNWNYHQ